jgi:hypothetical protein
MKMCPKISQRPNHFKTDFEDLTQSCQLSFLIRESLGHMAKWRNFSECGHPGWTIDAGRWNISYVHSLVL